MEDKQYRVITINETTSKKLSLGEAETVKIKMLKKLSDPKMIQEAKKTLKHLSRLPGINLDRMIEERQKLAEKSVEILPADEGLYVVRSKSSTVSMHTYDEAGAKRLQDKLVRLYTKVPKRNTLITVDIVEV